MGGGQLTSEWLWPRSSGSVGRSVGHGWMTVLVEDDWKYFCAGVDPEERMFLLPTTARGKGTTRFRGVGGKKWWGKDGQLNISHEDVRRRKITNTRFGGGLRKGVLPLTRPTEDKTSGQSMLEQENTDENLRSMSALSFSSGHVASLCPANWSSQLSWSLSFSRRLLTNCYSE